MFNRETADFDPTSGARPIEIGETRAMLARILNHCHDGVMAFDLDSTLLDNRPRNARIMREFGRTLDHPQLIKAQPDHWQSWSAVQAMQNIGLSANEAAALCETYDAFWAQRFFTSEYCRDDCAIAGAAHYVQSVADKGGTIVYLTGRPESMRDGTRQSLNRLAFPSPDNSHVNLWMKPQADQSDDDFKQQAFSNLTTLGQLVGAFDNEPTHINAYRIAFPRATCIHLFTDHSMRPVKLTDDIISIRHFAP